MKFSALVMVATVLLATCSTLARQQGAPKWHQLTADYSFEQYMQDFHKPYATGSVEWFERKGLFEASLKRILAHNADASQSYKKGVNQFTDLTEDERLHRTTMFTDLRGKMAGRGESISHEQYKALVARNATPPTPSRADRFSVDYRKNVPAVLTNVKDQGACGSCWSFGTTESIETQYALQFGKLHVLSEQQLVSCVPNISVGMKGSNETGTMGGCHGYLPNLAIDHLVSQGGGQTTEWMNPYTAYWNQWPSAPEPLAKCRKTVPGGNFVNVTGYNFVEANNVEAFKQTLAEVGPVAIVMYVPQDFMHYESGVYHDQACIGNQQMEPSHVVLLVGYGHDADLGKDYWIVRNSWSTKWGEDGYFRLLREDSESSFKAACGAMPLPEAKKGTDFKQFVDRTACGTCGILAYGMVPTVSF